MVDVIAKVYITIGIMFVIYVIIGYIKESRGKSYDPVATMGLILGAVLLPFLWVILVPMFLIDEHKIKQELEQVYR